MKIIVSCRPTSDSKKRDDVNVQVKEVILFSSYFYLTPKFRL